jgi:hypothetical protein
MRHLVKKRIAGSMAEAITMAVSTMSTMSRKNHSSAASPKKRITEMMLQDVM